MTLLVLCTWWSSDFTGPVYCMQLVALYDNFINFIVLKNQYLN